MTKKILANHKPKLRWPINIEYSEIEGQKAVVLSDKWGIASKPAAFPSSLLPVIARFDGENSIADIALQGRNYGITVELVTQLVEALYQLQFLEAEDVRVKWRELKEKYRTIGVRKEALAGTIYPQDPKVLRRVLDDYIARSKTTVLDSDFCKKAIGFIAPHIDYTRGWQTYGAGFAALKQTARPDVIFLFGTSHQPGEGFFSLTDKDFSTPLGIVPVHEATLATVLSKYGRDRALCDEILHRDEHSIELQLPFLMHCYSNGGCPPIVPILVGSFHEFLRGDGLPTTSSEVEDFIGIVADTVNNLRREGKKVLFYAGVDFAHVGRHFGDREPMDRKSLAELEARDGELIRSILSGKSASVFAHVASDLDRRRICGFPSLYSMLSIMEYAGIEATGECIEYRQAVEEKSDCTVSFASILLREKTC
ncbi:MAG: AmmeMemoRadiSam system protein B [Deltaproteobacteria bacterium]|nr:AmmeMemoRadiSam system protein B [Deltaproteobacteria bacterium]